MKPANLSINQTLRLTEGAAYNSAPENAITPRRFAYVGCATCLFLMLVAPEFVSPAGRFGYEAPIFALLIPLTIVSVNPRGIMRLLPVALPLVAAIVSYSIFALTSQDEIFEASTRSVASFGRNIVYILAGLLFGERLSARDLSRIQRWFLWCVIAVIIFGILQVTTDFGANITLDWYWQNDDSSPEDSLDYLLGRPPSTFTRVFSYSFFVTSLFLTLVGTELKLSRGLKPLLLLGTLVAAVLSQTKGALLALLAGLLTASFISRPRITLLYVVPGLILLGVTINYAVDVTQSTRLEAFAYLFQGDVSSFVARMADDPNVIARQHYIEDQWEIFRESPIFGNMLRTDLNESSDNLYVHMLAKMGLLGLASVLCVPVYFLWLYRRYRRYSRTLGQGRGGLLEPHLFFAQLLAWAAFVGLVMGVSWNLFVGNRAIVCFYFLAGILEGQWSQLARPTAQPSLRQISAT